MLLLLATGALTAAAAQAATPSLLLPIEPRVNGLLAADRVHTSFNVGAHSDEGLTLSWHVQADASALGGHALEVASFEVELSQTGSLIGGGGADGAAPLRWSSGATQSAEPSLQLPRSLVQRLSPGASFSFKVRLRDALTGGDTAWSEETSFDTAPPASVWAGAAWIGGGSELRTDVSIPPGTIKSARAYASGVGVMELHLNGAKVGDHYCDPGEAVYDQKILFVSFDVSSALKAGGSNAIGARLGNSKWGYLDIYSNRTKHGDQVRKRRFFAQFYPEKYSFSKTGSGQT
jgi:alpha-L-rhamnosidase